ncbi:MAG: hypothetical protein EA409_02475 [Saprospirales bacterium]|nr:MAG: hypothetical protein EA409_02475 [Saprospirales bacterium]
MRKQVTAFYPKAEPASVITGDYLKLVQEGYGFDLNKTLFATSICSDDVNISAEFRNIHERPFVMGGLSGFPFTGRTGMVAFAHHVPDEGYAFIFFGPHIGINSEGGIGKILRYGQKKHTTCCGAIALALDSILGKIPPIYEDGFSRDFDYQEYYLLDCLSESKERLMNARDPILSATEMAYSKIATAINNLVVSAKSEFSCRQVALLGGIIINTDHGHEDYVDVRDFTVLEMEGP